MASCPQAHWRVRQALVTEAVAVCLTCPVQVACGRLGVELTAKEWLPDHVVYGGMDVPELRAMARRLGRAAVKTAARQPGHVRTRLPVR